MIPQFDYEKYLMFWKLRDIVTEQDKHLSKIRGFNTFRTRVSDGDRTINIVYVKENIHATHEYSLLMVEVKIKVEHPELGTPLNTILTGLEALQEIESI